jgi:anti-sigma factor RsiW
MMEKIPRLNSDQRSNLIAYLDGELPEPAAKEIEHVLSRSPTVQHDVEMLSRTWDLLDQLPRLTGSSDLTNRMVTVVKEAEEPKPFLPATWLARIPKEPLRRGGIVAVWAAGLALAAVAGFLVTNRMMPDPSQELLKNLPVIEKLDLYSNVETIDFLRELDKRSVVFHEPSSSTP